MNKANVFCSSSFYMGTGDILHILIIDEVGNPVEIELSTGDDNVAPSAPFATAATDRTETSFTANWMYNENSTGYYLDVAEDIDFTSFVLGFNNKDIGNDISDAVAGLVLSTPYYYRVRAYNDYGTSPNSNVIILGTSNPFGALYNRYAAVNVHGLAPSGWHIPTFAEIGDLFTFAGGSSGGLKEAGTDHWDLPNTGATNALGFTALGSGIRVKITGIYDHLRRVSTFWMSTDFAGVGGHFVFSYSNATFGSGSSAYDAGYAIRPIKDDAIDPGTVTDYDGNVYSTVTIGTQVWMAENLKVTHYIDGTSIPNITDDTQWLNDTTGAMCYYNNVAP